MGWYGTVGGSKEDSIKEAEELATGYSIAARRTVGNEHWYVVKGPEFPEGIICLALLRKERDGWSYKPMDESVGPYYWRCPLAFLRLAKEYNAEWRAKVRAQHGARNEQVSL